MFEGRKITFTKNNGTVVPAIVVSCIKNIGITIVAEENTDRILFCVRMKNAPNFAKGKGQVGHTEKVFTSVRKQILTGNVHANLIGSIEDISGAEGTICPFR